MSPHLEKSFRRLEASKEKVIADLKQCSDELLNQKPGPEAWSAAEVVHHLITTEEASLRYLNKKIQGINALKSTGIRHSLRIIFMKLIYSLPLKYKAPAVTHPATSHLSFSELESNWASVRQSTLALLSPLNDKELRLELWRHPVGGRMNILQMLDFFDDHIERHRLQIERTLKQVKGTASNSK